MGYERHISIGFDWVGVHRWKDAPDSHEFLRFPHRHKFIGEAVIEVDHNEREVEFFEVQELILREILPRVTRRADAPELSCEGFAELILEDLKLTYGAQRLMWVTISEDGENAGTVTWVPDEE